MATTSEEIQDNRIGLRALEESAREHAKVGRYEGALRSIAGGADWAWFNHTGVFASATFENLLPAIGAKLTQGGAPTPARGRRRVLHVLTQAYPTGGHSRLAWRWMSIDEASEHSVLLTSQHDLEIPPELLDGCDGRLVALTNTLMVDKVRALGDALMDFDLIVLHIHPFDAVAVAACAGLEQRPRTLLVNHADHVFWLGLSAADQIVNLRPASEWIATNRRTGSSEGFARLALPLDEPAMRAYGGSHLRASLGVAAHEPVMSTIAQPYKYATSGDQSFLSLAERLFRRLPSVHLIAIGPSDESPGWRDLQREFPNRVHLLGIRTEYRSVLEASDVYLDSFPFSSITSMLEAATHGVPVVTMSNPSNGPLNFDDYELIPDLITSPEEWLESVALWCNDRELARSAGSRMRHAVTKLHGRTAWLEQLESVYSMPWRRTTSPLLGGSTRIEQYDDAIHDLHRAGGLTRDFKGLMEISRIRLEGKPSGVFVEA